MKNKNTILYMGLGLFMMISLFWWAYFSVVISSVFSWITGASNEAGGFIGMGIALFGALTIVPVITIVGIIIFFKNLHKLFKKKCLTNP